MLYSSKIKSLLIISFAFMLMRCEEADQGDLFSYEREEPTGSEELHPQSEAIPYMGQEHISIDQSQGIGEMENNPVEAQLLQEYLQDPTNVELVELNIHSQFAASMIAKPLNRENLAILEVQNQRLYQYNVATNDSIILAERGQGPGEIQYPRDIAVSDEGDELFVAMENMRIDRYNCSDEICEYEESIATDQLTHSLTVADEEELAVVTVPNPMEDDIDEAGKLVNLSDFNSDELLQFGKSYDTDIPLAFYRYSRQADVLYCNKTELFVVTFSSFPLVYLYDRNGQLTETYEISPFQLPTDLFDHEGGSTHGMEPSSSLRANRIPGQTHVLLRVGSTGEQVGEPVYEDTVYEQRFDFYLLDLTNSESYFIGTKQREASYGLTITPLENGLLVNDGGELRILI